MAKRIGILGGGQLGMMLYEARDERIHELSFLDPDPHCSCARIGAPVTQGSFSDEAAVLAFGADKDILTVEIEHVHVGALRTLREQGVEVHPDPDLLALIQDKGDQKMFYREHGFPTSAFELLPDGSSLELTERPFPFVMKSRRGGYDGQGVQLIRTEADMKKAFAGPVLLEEMVPFEKEIAVIAARNTRGEVKSYPAVEMDFDPDVNLVRALFSPAAISTDVERGASKLAMELAEKMGIVGLLAVEFFLMKNGNLLVNEVAPRPHNSGHHTIEANLCSQYEQHLRAITGADLGDTALRSPAVMVNLLGAEGYHGERIVEGLDELAKNEKAYMHDYQKLETRPNRKMGHITVLSDQVSAAMHEALHLQKVVRFVSKS